MAVLGDWSWAVTHCCVISLVSSWLHSPTGYPNIACTWRSRASTWISVEHPHAFISMVLRTNRYDCQLSDWRMIRIIWGKLLLRIFFQMNFLGELDRNCYCFSLNLVDDDEVTIEAYLCDGGHFWSSATKAGSVIQRASECTVSFWREF